MRKFLLIITTFLFWTPHLLSAQTNSPDTVLVGAYVSSLHDFDIASNSINADIHLWCLYDEENYSFENELECLYCNEFNLTGTSVEVLNGKQWFYTKATIDSRQKYLTSSFPFDTQKIVFGFESSEYTTDDFVFKSDVAGSKLDSIVLSQFDEWEIENIEFRSSATNYNTSFGDMESSLTTVPKFEIIISIKRLSSWLILFKLITGIIVAFLISSCVFWIKPVNTDPRFGLCVGGLFAAIGNKYIVESIVPSTNELTLLDYLHNITFIIIFLIIITSVFSLFLYEKGDEKSQKISGIIDKLSFFLFVFVYVFSFSYLINSHYQF
ncbi:MAG: hypothetical protein LW711_14505 [Saprospiraceae bacterium]|jgi:hypothetical protein|nr:hypothetical protein [Algoriphagus sp.]MCE2771197.1 hypothetical protein [Saprospiraceae bacterium]